MMTTDLQAMNKLVLAINQRLTTISDTTSSEGTAITPTDSFGSLDRTRNNISIGRGTYFEIAGVSSDAGITGIAGGSDGRLVVLKNTGNLGFTLYHDSNASLTTNRIYTRSGAVYNVNVNAAVLLLYSTARGGWIPVGALP